VVTYGEGVHVLRGSAARRHCILHNVSHGLSAIVDSCGPNQLWYIFCGDRFKGFNSVVGQIKLILAIELRCHR